LLVCVVLVFVAFVVVPVGIGLDSYTALRAHVA